MRNYLKLLHMEIHRFRSILFVLMGLTALVQICAIAFSTIGEINERNAYFQQTGKPAETFFAAMSFTRTVQNTQFWFAVPVGLSIAVLVIYAFLIWYRDWFGRSTFAFRLLALPSERRNVYFAKLTAILTFIFAMLGFQLLLMPICRAVFTMIAPADQIQPSFIADAIFVNQAFKILLPRSFGEFFVNYGIGIIALLILFASILLERSYRWLGIAFGLAYAGLCAALMIFPPLALGAEYSAGYLYTEEIYAIQIAIDLLIAIVSVWLGLYLLKKKVSV
ncbi:hypothetical protein J4772_15075 [Cohnella sp. LGH]|uniref:hypothetical protein n=1 Tax=Cohnella sp. LGH TaxID=1619153 RepID=UPI001ADAF25D|nr:hypothetical protein [Cohnella sp. LGH]QTH45618.1 hypothetical protein J4772_15075 [Cohnella sp. LGH]